MAQYVPQMLFVLALLLSLVALGHLATARWSRKWLTTLGRVKRSAIIHYERYARGFRPAVLYEYRVGGRHYESHRIAFFATILRDEAAANRWAAPYATGQEVAVYYWSWLPQVAVLHTGEVQVKT